VANRRRALAAGQGRRLGYRRRRGEGGEEGARQRSAPDRDFPERASGRFHRLDHATPPR
jgi:hypothetical protein